MKGASEIGNKDRNDMKYGLKAAALVRPKVAELCPGGDISCFPFHAIRPYLRLFGMVGGPGRNEAFFLDALAAANHDKTGTPRILIAGSADDSMYALARRAAPEGKITVLDRCDLPLYLCRRAAEENSDTIETNRRRYFRPCATGRRQCRVQRCLLLPGPIDAPRGDDRHMAARAAPRRASRYNDADRVLTRRTTNVSGPLPRSPPSATGY